MTTRLPPTRHPLEQAAAPGPVADGRRVWLAVAAIIVVTAAAYAGAFRVPFLWDDTQAIVENPNVRRLWPIWDAMSSPRQIATAGRPVLSLSFALNYAISGFRVWSYHLVNMTIHILAALTLLGVCRRTFLSEPLRRRFGRAATGLALAITLVWAVHPLHTMAVTYINQRAESMMGLFYLLTLYCSIRAFTAARPARWCAAAVAACAAGMGVKEVMATAPLMVFLYDILFAAGSLRAAFRRRLFYTMLAATWIIVAIIIASGPRNESVGLRFVNLSPLDYARTQTQVILHYLRLAAWPSPLVFDYQWPIVRRWSDCAPQAAVVVALLLATAWALRRHPPLGFLGAWFFVILGPSSSFLPILTQVACEYRVYLPLAAVVAAVVVAGFASTEKLVRTGAVSPRTAQGLRAGAVAAIVLVLGLLTWQRNRVYQSESTLWRSTVEQAPHNAGARVNLGIALFSEGDARGAIEQFKEAARLDPNYSDAHLNWGYLLVKQGQFKEGVAKLTEALRLAPDSVKANANYGTALLKQGRAREAIEYFRKVVRLRPNATDAHRNLGIALAADGQRDAAVEEFRQALRLRPDSATEHFNLGRALAHAGRIDDGVAHLREALRLDPGSAQTHNELGIVYGLLGRADDAVACFREALRYNPRFAQARYNLGAALMAKGMIKESIEQYEAVAAIDPALVEAHASLGIAYASQGRVKEALSHDERVVELLPDSPVANGNLAWLLATYDKAQGGDPARALALAQRAYRLAGDQNADALGALAAALAASGRFGEAIEAARRAAALMAAGGRAEMAVKLRRDAELYEAGKPSREPAAALLPPRASSGGYE